MRARLAERRGCRVRSLRLEPLEQRTLLDAAQWHNYSHPLDVDASSIVSSVDAVVVINRLLQNGPGPLPPTVPPAAPRFYVDTTGDNYLAPLDALRIINRLITPPTVTLSAYMPYSIDVTPRLHVAVHGPAAISDQTEVDLDVDLDGDGFFDGPGERNHTTATLFNGLADFDLTPAVPASPADSTYQIKLRARLRDSDAVEGTSAVEPLVIDTRTSSTLSDFAHAFDPATRYSVDSTIQGVGYKIYNLDFVSQNFRSPTEVDRTEWHHWMQIVVPDEVDSTTALLFIDSGGNGGSAPTSVKPVLLDAVMKAHTVGIDLRQIPNEPLSFPDDPPGTVREEDEIIAYTFDKYLSNYGQPGYDNWPLLEAMVKSAVKAMDQTEVFAQTLPTPLVVDHFAVTGYSKRGWTTWLTAAADDRVVGIIPGIFDNLNQGLQMVHHEEVYGFFSDAVVDYVDAGIFSRLESPAAQELSRIVDPYHYLNNGNFNIPKLMLNAAADEFFVSDSAQFYFHDLPGTQNYLRYIPNSGHDMPEASRMESTTPFYDAIVYQRTLPQFSWTVDPDGSIHVQTVTAPTQVTLWQATDPDGRDFRWEYNAPPPQWSGTTLDPQSPGVYVASTPMPAVGSTAFFVELKFASPVGTPYIFTTEIHINTLQACTPGTPTRRPSPSHRARLRVPRASHQSWRS